MPIWSFCIADDPGRPDEGRGFVRAATATEALWLIGDTRANVYPCPEDVALPAGCGIHCDDSPFMSSPLDGSTR